MRQVGATLHRGARASHYRGLLLRSTGSRCTGSATVAHGPSHSVACGIFPDQGLNPCPLHWQADSQPLRHQGSPLQSYFKTTSQPASFGSQRTALILFFFFNLFIYFIYLFLAALGLRCCVRAFSSCGERGLLFIAVHGLLIALVSLVAEHGL